MEAQAPGDFNSIPEGPLTETLLGLDRVQAAATVSRLWRGIISDEKFLKRFRERHPSSPLLGIFASDIEYGGTFFSNVSSDPDLIAVVSKADTALAYLDRDYWRIQDCRNGRLLLSSDKNELRIYDPLSTLSVPVPKPNDRPGKYLSYCLLDGNGTSSCGVVSVQRCGKSVEASVSYRVISLQKSGRRIRAVEYKPSMHEWHAHPWYVSPLADDDGAMYAAGHIFWRYGAGSLLVLDTTTSTMCFSMLALPWKLTFHQNSRFAIGEIEDGKGCLVCLQVPDAYSDAPISHPYPETRLQVWLLEKTGADICWEFKEEMLVSKLLGADAQVWKVSTVINGLALLSKHQLSDQYVVDLQSMTRLANVKFRGEGYLYQMPWPPAGLAATSARSTPPHKDNCVDNLLSSSVGSKSSHDGVDLVHRQSTDGAEHSKLSSSSMMRDPPTLSTLDTPCFQNQYMNPHDVNEGSGDEAAPSENHQTIMSPVNITKTVEVENSKNHLNSAKHDLSEKASLDLDGDSARIQQVKMYRSHELTANSEKSTGNQQMAANSEDHLNECNTYKRKVNPQSEVHNLTDEEPCGQRKKLNTNAASNACPQEIDQHIPSPSSCVNPLVVESEIIPTTVLHQYNLRVHCWKSSVGQLGTTHDVPLNKDASNCPKQGDPPEKSRRKEAAHPKGARSTQSSHAVHDISSAEAEIISTPTVLQTNLRATCRNSSMGIPATQEKALRKHTCSYTGCGKKYTRMDHLKRHVKNQHTRSTILSILQHTCSYTGCGKKYTSMDHLKRHVKNQHTRGTIRLMCRIKGCTKGFFIDNNRKIHEESSAHVKPGTPGTWRIKCQIKSCLSTFGTPGTPGTWRIKCQIKSCLSTFGTRRSHNKHYRDFHQKTSASRGGSGRPRKEKT